MLFALYVQFHGDYGPGGGFQAGVIFAAAVILYALVFGLYRAEKPVPAPADRSADRRRRAALRLGGPGVDALGGNFLDYDRSPTIRSTASTSASCWSSSASASPSRG